MALCCCAKAQYAPSAGMTGSTAIGKTDSRIKGWAVKCHIYRGYLDIAHKNDGFASVGDSTSAIGASGVNGTVSLGDSGVAILEFANPIKNGAGYDFAIFENSFSDSFLELAFVEVSSNGEDFYRFPAHSQTPTAKQTGSFDYTQPTNINNLAGKYRATYGTPFDLEELKNIPLLDIDNITHVKIIDVVGSIDPNYGQKDTAGNYINDPYPTAFPSGGFDLDAVAVLNFNISSTSTIPSQKYNIYPNPIENGGSIWLNNWQAFASAQILNMNGKSVWSFTMAEKLVLPQFLQNGIYILALSGLEGTDYQKIEIR